MAVSAFLFWREVFPLFLSSVFAVVGCGVLILSVVALVRKSPRIELDAETSSFKMREQLGSPSHRPEVSCRGHLKC